MEDNELLMSAAAGNPEAQNYVASRIMHDEPSRAEEALFLYLSSASQGYIEAMWNAGGMVLERSSSEDDKNLGLDLIRKAASAGECSACLFIANCYEQGLYGFDKDTIESEIWKRSAWENSNISDFTDALSLDEYILKNNLFWTPK